MNNQNISAEKSKYNKLKHYFSQPTVVPPLVLMIQGIFLCGIGLILNQIYIFGGPEGGGPSIFTVLLCFAPAILLAFSGFVWLVAPQVNKLAQKPNDEEVDDWFRQDMEILTDKGYKKMELEEKDILGHGVITLKFPALWPVLPNIETKDFLWKKGKDGITRAAVYQITNIYLTEHYFACYSCDLNFRKREVTNERTDEYHYKDVVSISTLEEAISIGFPFEKILRALSNFIPGLNILIEILERKNTARVQKLKLSVSSGDSVQVGLVAIKQTIMGVGVSFLPTEIDHAITTIRSSLEEKRANYIRTI